MYCPRCGQQQISDQTKFCSRCGFLLAVVGDVLQNNGTLPQLEALNQAPKGIFTRRNGVMFSFLWFMFFLFIITPFWAIVDVEEMAAISAVLAIFGGLIFLIISLFMLKKPVKSPAASTSSSSQPAQLFGHPAQHALPGQQTEFASDYAAPRGSWRDTNDLVEAPRSVTETTTKLLSKNE